jgi:hypothetical protein
MSNITFLFYFQRVSFRLIGLSDFRIGIFHRNRMSTVYVGDTLELVYFGSSVQVGPGRWTLGLLHGFMRATRFTGIMGTYCLMEHI